MGTELLQYMIFLLSVPILLWGTVLWLKSNKTRRKQKDDMQERLEIQKQLHKQALLEKRKKGKN